MNQVETQVLQKIDANWDQDVEFLRGLVRRPSTLGEEAQVQQFVARELESVGLETDVWRVDHAEIAHQVRGGGMANGTGTTRALQRAHLPRYAAVVCLLSGSCMGDQPGLLPHR